MFQAGQRENVYVFKSHFLLTGVRRSAIIFIINTSSSYYLVAKKVQMLPELQLLDLISRLHFRLGRRLAPLFHAEKLSGKEVFVLWKVNEKGALRTTELARDIGIPLSTFTGIFDRLVSRGLLERVPDPEDRRGVLARSTPALQELLSHLKTAIENELQDIFGALPGEHSRRLLDDLQALSEYLDRKEKKEHGR